MSTGDSGQGRLRVAVPTKRSTLCGRDEHGMDFRMDILEALSYCQLNMNCLLRDTLARIVY